MVASDQRSSAQITQILYSFGIMTDNELTYQIRGAIFDVYNTLGPGLLESVYEEALCFELQQRGLLKSVLSVISV